THHPGRAASAGRRVHRRTLGLPDARCDQAKARSMRPAGPSTADRDLLAGLVYELLDAHDDTARLVSESAVTREQLRWRAHLEYLRALQRKGRELLTRAAAEGVR